jgi:tetratricopeptide (TPR) repeat protein
MRLPTIASLLTLLFTLSLSSSLAAQEAEPEERPLPAPLPPVDPGVEEWLEQPLHIGDVLYYQGDYFRAVGEYERHLIAHPDDAQRDEVRLKIAWIYARSERLAAAAAQLEAIISERPLRDRMGLWARVYYGDVAAKARQRTLARKAYEVVVETCEGLGQGSGLPEDVAEVERMIVASDCPALLTQAQLGLATYWAEEHDFTKAAAALEALPRDVQASERAREVAAYVRGIEPPSKSPALAGVLSIVPGLGHAYIEEYSSGVVALLWNGAFIYALVDSIMDENIGQAVLIGLLESVWYSGTIFGAVSGAHRFNRDAQRIVEEGFVGDVHALSDPTPWPARFPRRDGVPKLQFKFEF